MTLAARRSIASFDSATAMLRAVAGSLSGQGMPALGVLPRPLVPVAERALPSVNLLPDRAREAVYAYGSGREGVPPEQVGEVSGEAVARWMADHYPQRRHPAVAIGASSGALAHLCAALRIPFLPATFLLPVRERDVHPDEPRRALEAGLAPAQHLLDANPELELHHMHDPNQDRLSLRRIGYFRLKRRTLGDAFERFLLDRLEDGGTILFSDGRLRWPVTRVGERHVFQFGALGGMEPDEFHAGSARVADYLAHYRSHVRRWDPPPPDDEAPEAEWGVADALRGDVERFAARHGFVVRTITFEDPEELSPAVADLYRRWQPHPGLLLVESFVLLDPWWTLRLGAIPFWLKFAVDSSADRLERYLDDTEFDEIAVTLFSHGTEGVGVSPIERWQRLAARGRRRGHLVGVDPRRFPRDFASFVRFGAELRRLGPSAVAPAAVTLSDLADWATFGAGTRP